MVNGLVKERSKRIQCRLIYRFKNVVVKKFALATMNPAAT